MQGWVEKEHRKGFLTFLHIRDGNSNETIQAVIPKNVNRNIGIGSAVEVEGKWKETGGGGQQVMELFAAKCKVWCKDDGQVWCSEYISCKNPSNFSPFLETLTTFVVNFISGQSIEDSLIFYVLDLMLIYYHINTLLNKVIFILILH